MSICDYNEKLYKTILLIKKLAVEETNHKTTIIYCDSHGYQSIRGNVIKSSY